LYIIAWESKAFPSEITHRYTWLFCANNKNLSFVMTLTASIVSLKFNGMDKPFNFITFDTGVKLNDLLFAKLFKEQKIGRVVDIRYVYEDQIPLPLSKMPIAMKNNSNN
jgi:hypothetical protein